jgi:hypothetical protein
MAISTLIEPRVQQQLNELILEWIDRLDLDAWKVAAAPEITAPVVSWAFYGAGLQCSRGSRPLPVEDVADQAISLLAGGLEHPAK